MNQSFLRKLKFIVSSFNSSILGESAQELFCRWRLKLAWDQRGEVVLVVLGGDYSKIKSKSELKMHQYV